MAATVVLAMSASACLTPEQWGHLQWAHALVANVDPSRNTYAHKSAVTFPGDDGGAHGAVDADCSGLVNALLGRAYGVTREEFRAWLGKERPRAHDYHDAIAAGRGFATISRAPDIRPGDLVATKLPEGSADTGHLMIASGPARERTPSAPLVEGTRQWDLDIIDSTGTPHGPADTRRHADGTHGSGIGRGTLRLYTSADGTLVGYAWSPSPKVRYRSRDEHGLAVGRVIVRAEWLAHRWRQEPARAPGPRSPPALPSEGSR